MRAFGDSSTPQMEIGLSARISRLPQKINDDILSDEMKNYYA